VWEVNVSNRCSYFNEVLKAELDDMLEDIAVVEQRYAERHNNEQISNYVYHANESVLYREAESIKMFLKLIDEIEISRYKTIESLVLYYDSCARDLVTRFEEPELIYAFLKRKLDKVTKYLQAGESS